MRIVGQDIDGRLIIDLEGEAFMLSKPIPGDSPSYICNGIFTGSNSIPNGFMSNMATTNPISGLTYSPLPILNPVDTSDFPGRVPKYEEITDPIENRFVILDL